jgi:hypothetical protein
MSFTKRYRMLLRPPNIFVKTWIFILIQRVVLLFSFWPTGQLSGCQKKKQRFWWVKKISAAFREECGSWWPVSGKAPYVAVPLPFAVITTKLS